MVVGGDRDGTYLNSGGRYDPVGDSWIRFRRPRAFPRIGTPPFLGGYAHDRVGRILEQADSPPGGRYDPGTDTWIPTAPPPSRRAFLLPPYPFWTGKPHDRLGWGGDPIITNSGGR
jgi:hypothetical protein